MTEIIIGLGSNVGDKEANLRKAIHLINSELLTDIVESDIYKSPPLLPKSAPSDWNHEFLNMVIAGNLQSACTPAEFLRKIKDFEASLGRKPSARWAPRIIDIDILAWGDETIKLPELVIPHPEMLNRDFVMKPLRQIRPHWKHP